MTPAELLEHVEAHGGALHLAGDRLKVRAPEPLPEAVMALVRGQREDLRHHLQQLEVRLGVIAGRHGWTVGELEEACGSEWEWLRVRPEVLEPVVAALAASQAIDRGEVPDGWTDTLQCPACGPVPIWPGGGAVTDAVGCPWCGRRAQGLPVPAPTNPLPPARTASTAAHRRAALGRVTLAPGVTHEAPDGSGRGVRLPDTHGGTTNGATEGGRAHG
jgi:hypothetical protein